MVKCTEALGVMIGKSRSDLGHKHSTLLQEIASVIKSTPSNPDEDEQKVKPGGSI